MACGAVKITRQCLRDADSTLLYERGEVASTIFQRRERPANLNDKRVYGVRTNWSQTPRRKER